MSFRWFVKLDGQRVVGWLCPGCREWHQVPVGPEPRRGWTFSGTDEAPTLHPSLLIKSPFGHCCHFMLVDGRAQFLGDCTHPHAGQTLEVGPLPDWG